jgi:hypothetical protein
MVFAPALSRIAFRRDTSEPWHAQVSIMVSSAVETV